MNQCFLANVLLTLTAACNLPAQTTPASLAGLVLSEKSALDSTPDLGSWRNLHPRERLKKAAWDNEYETQGLWCAASIADTTLPDGVHVTRQAFFYIPPAKPTDPLPARQDASLFLKCRLFALWYEVNNPANPGELARSVSADLTASLGPADEPPRFKRPDGDWGSGYWNPYRVWERANRRLVLAVDPGGPVPDASTPRRLLVIARSSFAPRGLSLEWSGDTPKSQPALKNAADIGRVARVQNPCSFDDGHNNWQSGLVTFGEKLLRDFPASPWRSYVHLTLARTLAAQLTLAYPEVDPNGANRPTNPDALRRDAIAHFREFLNENPDSPEAGSAWREAWRLLASLPPSPIHFACTD